jgi:hypothetical protein
MAKIHILDQISPGGFNAVAHFLTPAGNNSVNVAWKTCYLASFGSSTPTSLLPSSGNNNPAPGKIGNTELNQITAGDVVEVPFIYSEEPGRAWTTAERQANMDVMADRAIDDFKAAFVIRFKFYGYTQGVAS